MCVRWSGLKKGFAAAHSNKVSNVANNSVCSFNNGSLPNNQWLSVFSTLRFVDFSTHRFPIEYF